MSNIEIKRPEILSPAGDMECIKNSLSSEEQ